MFLPLELAPLVFQFLPVETLEKFPEDDPLLVAVLKIQQGCRPFKVTYLYDGAHIDPSVTHKRFILQKVFSKELLLSLGGVHKIELRDNIPDTFASTLCQKDKADDSYPFPRAKELFISPMDRTISKIDLSMFPNLRKLYLNYNHSAIISPRSRTILLDYISSYGSRTTVDGVCDLSSDEFVTIEMKKDQSFMKLKYHCVDWKPCFNKSWCRSMELHCLIYSVDKLKTLEKFLNLKILTFVESSIHLSQKWIPNLPLEELHFRDCQIWGTEIGCWPLVKELEFRFCEMEPLIGHFPQLESLMFHEASDPSSEDEEEEPSYERLNSVPIAKENLRKVKSLSLSTEARHFDLSSFEELKDLQLRESYKMFRLDGLNVDTLERVTIESCPNLEVNFPCHVSLKVSNAFSR